MVATANKKSLLSQQDKKPAKLDVIAENIPEALRAQERWVNWRWTWDGKRSKWDKPPCQADGESASSTESKTWQSFNAAKQAVDIGRFGLSGVGFCLGTDTGIVGIDLDDCRNPETGELTDLAAAIVTRFNSYSEVSPSQTGVKIFIKGSLPKGRKQNDTLGLEVYESGRYFTVTGHRLLDVSASIETRQQELESFHANYINSAHCENARKDIDCGDDLQVAQEALKHLAKSRADGYLDWLAVGMALRSVSPELLPDWDSWSQQSDKYQEDVCGQKWQSFNSNGVGIGSLIYWAKQDGWKPPKRTSFKRKPTHQADPPEDANTPDGPREAIDDPHRLARTYLREHGYHDNEQSLYWYLNEFQRFDGTAYRPVAGGEIKAEITRVVKAEFDAAAWREWQMTTALATEANGDEEQETAPPVVRKVTSYLVANIMRAVESETMLPGSITQPTWLVDDAPFPANEVLATESGLLHLPSLTSGEPCLLPCTPSFFSSNALPYGFDPTADCPQWLAFLDSLCPDDPQSIDTLQEWFGYGLTGDTQQHKLLMLQGPPRSGKGTIARILRETIGEQNLASPTLASLAGPFGLWPLLGKLVALVADARLSGRADAIAVVERLLSISGEDPQDVHRKNLPTLAGIRLPVRFVIMTNELPNMRDVSGALQTRVVLLRLTRSFLGREDRTLGKRLLMELPGVLNWAIRGWQRLNERGYFEQPDSGRELLDDLQDLASPITTFIRDCCIVGPEFSVPIDDLFREWKAWCESHGRDHPGTQQTFGRDLRAAMSSLKVKQPRADDGTRERVYHGIGLRESDVGTQWHAHGTRCGTQ